MKKQYFLFPTNYKLAIFFNEELRKYEIKEVSKSEQS